MRTYVHTGGGICLTYELDLDRGEYVVHNEDGEELFADGSEREAQEFCAQLTEQEPEYDAEDIAYLKAQSSTEWEESHGGGL